VPLLTPAAEVLARYEVWLADQQGIAEARALMRRIDRDAPDHQVIGLRIEYQGAGWGAGLRRATTADEGALAALQEAAYAPNRPLLGVEPVPPEP
jgi:hypothetical protein